MTGPGYPLAKLIRCYHLGRDVGISQKLTWAGLQGLGMGSETMAPGNLLAMLTLCYQLGRGAQRSGARD